MICNTVRASVKAAAISKLKSDYITRDNNAAINSAIIAAEKETEELELAKTIAVKKSVQDQINALNDLKEVNGELSDEEQKRLAELQDKLYDLDTDYAGTLENLQGNRCRVQNGKTGRKYRGRKVLY